ncbi:MAG: YbfB/YjiJ family MFS transporter [Proteobacteria bacterium]|nr:YbfB/YjiJ family MFS transporter [Burkholderiales bacterium]
MAIGRFAFTPLLPMMQLDAGLVLGTGARLASANYLGYLVGSVTALLITRATDRWIRVGLIAITLTTAAMGLTDEVWLWFILRFVTGVASAWVLIFASSWMFNRLVEAGKPRWGSFVFTGIGVGIVATGGVCLALVAAQVGSHATWLALGLLCSLATAAVWRWYRPRTEARGSASVDAPVRLTRASRGLIVGYALFGFAYIVPATFLPLLARAALEGTNAPGWVYAAYWPLVGTAAALSTLATLRFATSDDRQLRAAYLAQAIGVAAPAASSHPFALVVSAVLVGGTFVLITLTSLRVARTVAPAQATRLFTVMTIWFAFGQIAGPMFAERLVALHGDFRLALGVAAASLMLAAVLTPVAPAERR